MAMQQLKVVFFGTPEIAVPTLESLANCSNIRIMDVVTMPDRPSGRGNKLTSPEVAIKAKELNLSLFQTENINHEHALLEKWQKENIDFILVFAFAQFLSKSILKLPKLGCFNIHTSLLPKYRGAGPIQHALLNNESVTGISIQRMVSKMDAGDICFTKLVYITPTETYQTLYTRLKQTAADSIPEFTSILASGNIHFKPQDSSQVSFAPTIQKTDGFIDFSKDSFELINSKLKAFDPWPGIYCYLNGKRLKILEIEKMPYSLNPADISTKNKMLVIGCANAAVRIKTLQLEGKKACLDSDMINGIINQKELILNKENL